MNRIKFLQQLINKNKYSIYLEIGTQEGNSFLPIKCAKKIAVDPDFQIKAAKKTFWYSINWTNFNNSFFELTSDEFFNQEKEFLKQTGNLDIVFVDGLHTFSATLNDILNSLQYLNENGSIIVHDSFPPHFAASIKASNSEEAEKLGRNIKGWTGEWCGDTWKAIAYLKKKYPLELDVSVWNVDYGLGTILIRDSRSLELDIDKALFKEIEDMEYDDLIADPENLIGLKEFDEKMF